MSGTAFQEPIEIMKVDDLYASHMALDYPSYYADGEVNPFSGLCSIIPRGARFYTMIPKSDEDRLTSARFLMKAVAGRRKLRERLCGTDEVNYNHFSKAGQVVLIWA